VKYFQNVREFAVAPLSFHPTINKLIFKPSCGMLIDAFISALKSNGHWTWRYYHGFNLKTRWQWQYFKCRCTNRSFLLMMTIH